MDQNHKSENLNTIYTTEHNLLLARRIERYWDNRAESYTEIRKEDLHSRNYDIWLGELREHLPEGKQLRILDIGTSSGYIAIIAASLGHIVTGIDLSANMIEYAGKCAAEAHLDIDFIQMDAHRLLFPSGSFDAIIMRNTSWTLINVRRVYEECYRVLSPGGVLLIYDADYGTQPFYTEGMEDISPEAAAMYKESDEIKNELSISYVQRPDWDLAILRDCGFVHCECNTTISQMFKPHKPLIGKNKFTMFSVYAMKGVEEEKHDSMSLDQVIRRHVYLRNREARFQQMVFKHFSISGTNFHVLSLLFYHREGLRPSDISDYLLIPRQTITRIIADLTKENLISSQANSKDGRSFVVYLTERGIEYIEHMLKSFSMFENEIKAHFSEKEIRFYQSNYSKMLDALVDCMIPKLR